MKKHIAVLGSLCAGVMIAGASIGAAEARSTTGFSAFRIYIGETEQETPPQLGLAGYNACLVEDWGAVVNRCPVAVTLEFNLPIDYTGNHNIQVQDYWNWPTGTAPFSCIPYAYGGSSAGGTTGSGVNFTGGGQDYTAAVNVTAGGMSIQLFCWDVPPGAGIANINWNP